jgi:hypothetical protein
MRFFAILQNQSKKKIHQSCDFIWVRYFEYCFKIDLQIKIIASLKRSKLKFAPSYIFCSIKLKFRSGILISCKKKLL